MTPHLNRSVCVAATLLLYAGSALGGGGSPSSGGHGTTAPAAKPSPAPTAAPASKTPGYVGTKASGEAAKPVTKAESVSSAGTKPAASASVIQSPTAEQALAWLKEGNARFLKQNCENPNTGSDRISETAGGQHPFASILTCADSRIPVERVFDRGVGDLFVVRVAGNIAGESEMGTMEYGTGHLHTPLLVVMGHTSCGAVNAAASGAELHGAVGKLVERIRPSVEQARAQFPELKPEQIAPIAIRTNVMLTIENLITQSQEIGALVREGKLDIVGAIYDLNTGAVHFLGEHPQETALLKKAAQGTDAHADADNEKAGH